MRGLTARNEDEKEFIKTFDSLCYAHNRYQVWADFVHMFALAIVNSVDKAHFEEREKRYLRIVKPYKSGDLDKFAHLAAVTTMALNKNPNQDFLGELYMRCDLGNEHAGQFFTPYHLCEMMAKVTITEDGNLRQDLAERGWISICDTCIGGGAMLIGAVQTFRDVGINYQQDVMFVGQDIDPTPAMMAYIQLSLLGCPGYIKVGNALTDPLVGHVLFGEGTEQIYYTPMFFSDVWHMRRVAEQMKDLFRQQPKAAERPRKYYFFFDQETKDNGRKDGKRAGDTAGWTAAV